MLRFNRNEQKLLRYVAATVAYFGELRIIPRDIFRYPFDTVSLELLAKSVSITHSCLALIKADQAEEAFGLGRSLVEIALILRHLTRDANAMASEAYKFLHFSIVDKSFWLFQSRRVFTDPQMLADVDRLAAQWDLAGLNPMAATRTWSDKYNSWKSQSENHPMDDQIGLPSHRISKYAIEYTQASFFVHCTQPALDNFFPKEGTPFAIRASSKEFIDSRGITFFLLLTNLHQIVLYTLYGLNLDPPVPLIKLHSDILEKAIPGNWRARFPESSKTD